MQINYHPRGPVDKWKMVALIHAIKEIDWLNALPKHQLYYLLLIFILSLTLAPASITASARPVQVVHAGCA